jgi:hypothetical protein
MFLGKFIKAATLKCIQPPGPVKRMVLTAKTTWFIPFSLAFEKWATSSSLKKV